MDNKAYLPVPNYFSYMLKKYNLSEVEVLDSYDLVINLITLAKCNPELYNHNNEARYETKDEAILVDEKTTNAWLGHRNLKIIPTSLDFETEEKIIIEYLEQLISGCQIKNIKELEVDLQNSYFKESDVKKTFMVEEYITSIKPESTIHYLLTKRTDQDKCSYTLKLHSKSDDLEYVFEDRKLTPKEFYWILKTFEIMACYKYHETHSINNLHSYKIKRYENNVLLEFEENKFTEFTLPDNIEVKKDSPRILTE